MFFSKRQLGGIATLFVLAGSASQAGAQYRPPYPYPYPQPGPYPSNNYYNTPAGSYLQGTASVINAQGSLMMQQEQARLMREKAKQAELDTKRKSFDWMMYERANTPTFTEEQEKVNAMVLRRVMTNATQTEITSGKAQNLMMPYLLQLANQGIPGPPIPLDSEQMQQINVTVGTQGSIGILKDGGKLDWPLVVRGPAQKKLAVLLPKAVTATVDGTLDTRMFGEVSGGVRQLQEELRKKFHKEEIDGGAYLTGKRFLDELDGAVQMLQQPSAAKLLNGTYMATGRDVQELVQNMARKGLKFAPATPGEEAAYFALYSSLVSYAAGAQNSSAFRVQGAPASPYGPQQGVP